MSDFRQVVVDDLFAAVVIRRVNGEFPVESTGPQERLVKDVWDVGRAHREDSRPVGRLRPQPHRPEELREPAVIGPGRVHLQKQLVQKSATASSKQAHHAAAGHALPLSAARAAYGVDLINEDDARPILACQLARFSEQHHDSDI